ncbi:bifunctional biotin--[acetyl-CoA-carboxylase] ligase/biotin operon repressor BirA [Kistimonas asteriae]|uniref:bifunctional biotin--[acetyl-CoA-carboxylase] ligase/biotin operon repressor BirA n=1 Tax=Kistimonas asteriae TaxID=517724 RepID=UPI001BA9E34E|nr:bifunctional biotin--[acetyl-CoA-carboxylase] ligase/biotin operon repressor BirA [Kistimonas asteriae]
MQDILTLLQDGQFHSGEELGDALGISRAAVWKRLKQLEKQGLTLDAVAGKGYRLPRDVILLNSDLIHTYIDESVRSKIALTTLHSASSTNDTVLTQLENPEPVQICVAEHQTAGRGRRGRTWISPLGANIYFSMVWRFDSGMSGLDGLSLVVGLAVLKTLEKMGATGLALKWPNDLLCSGKKLAGILLEINGDPNGECQVVIGIGINIKLSQEQLNEISQPAIDLCTVLGMTVDKNQVVGELIGQLVSFLDVFQEKGFTPFREDWQRYDAYAGQEVRLITGIREITGTAAGVNEQGALMLDHDGEKRAYAGGEVSLRPYEYS